MVKQAIQIFARIKPTKGKLGVYELDDEPDEGHLLSFNVPRDQAEGLVNNKKELYKFRFQKVFDQKTKQDEIFDHVAKPVIDNVLRGYNGTIFAYGQTGSGKTFTITGGPERYGDRGIIPRTLSYIYDYYEQNSESVFTTHVSYLEIYNENGYDLLDPKHEASKLEDLPKVSLMEDADQNVHLKNLSTHQASNEEESLNLLFLGDTNRMIAETPMNQASTRSHCIFTVHISSREAGSATLRRSKLHLVDLAGSERVSKTGVNGLLLTEAKYINLSLHYLEQVIVSLSEKGRHHIPYRNSMMTSVLRDSLGGNCMTTMVATCSVERKNIDESISTCRFAQRVAMIKNDAILNEELDPKLMIAKLKREVQELKEELAMATGQQRTDALSDEELERCQEAVKFYLEDRDPESTINVGADMRKIHECFRILKKMVLDKGARRSSSPAGNAELEQPRTPETYINTSEVKKLKGIIMQRDNEINILVNMLKKEKKRAADALARLEGHGPIQSADPGLGRRAELSNGHDQQPRAHSGHERGSLPAPQNDPVPNKWNEEKERLKREKEEKTKAKILGEMSLGRQEAFEIFRRDYEDNRTIEENKQTLKNCYAQAKSLGEAINQSRTKINKLKASIEQHRMSRVMQGLVDPQNPEPDDMEVEMREAIEREKARYKEAFTELRSLKSQIEHLQHLLEKAKVQLMKDFELWWAKQAASMQEQQSQVKSAWKTPPVTPNSSSFGTSSQASFTSDGSSRTNSASIPAHVRQSSSGRSSVAKRISDTSGYQSQDSARSQSSSRKPKSSGPIPLTGDAEADADIMAFLKARKNIMKQAQSQGHR